jgi:hypothetical protein
MTSQSNVRGTWEGATGVQCGDGDVVSRIVSAVARREGVEPTELDTRLYDAIDPDALSSLVENAPESGVTIGFDYVGYRVTVVADEELHVDVVAQR